MNSSIRQDAYLTEQAAKRPKWHIPVGILSLTFAAATIDVWMEDSPADENFAIWLLAYTTVMGLVLWPLFHAVRWWVRQKSAIKISKKLSRYEGEAIRLDRLDQVLDEKNAENKIRSLLKTGFLQRMTIEGGMLVLDGDEQKSELPEVPATESPDPIIAQIRYLEYSVPE